ncbi:protein kinase [Acidobacteriota bacterium]
MKCPQCNSDIVDDSKFCKECGSNITSVEEAQQLFTKTLESPAFVLDQGKILADRYEILEKIGEGGMGEVWLAIDKNLDRQVAIKILPAAFSEDPERLARFEREAKLLAALNHTNIAAIHGLEESDAQRFLVLELAEGETLKVRLDNGPLEVDEALDLGHQITEGLEAAHAKGIIHRDLKPGNIMVTPEGKIKILDFGLAKAFTGETTGTGIDIEKSPTITAQMTKPGVILGTAAYMSPEQARGRAVDKRTDIWSFGCVLFECLTGMRAFHGETVSDTLAHILKGEPNWNAFPANLPAGIRMLLRRCLQKNQKNRLHDIADARIEIEESSKEPHPGAESPDAEKWSRSKALWWALSIIVALSLGAAAALFLRPTSSPEVTKFSLKIAPAQWLGVDTSGSSRYGLSRNSIALSPDGTKLIFSAGTDQGSCLYLRSMSEMEASPIEGTESGIGPFFSPDGQWVGFWAAGKLLKTSLDGGPPIIICDTGLHFGASWGPKNTIVFAPSMSGGIYRVSAEGGVPEGVTTLAEGEYSHRLPHFLPGSDTLLITVMRRVRDWSDVNIVAHSILTGERKPLIENGAEARFSPTGHLVFVRQGTLFAVPFDPKNLEITGAAVEVLSSVRQAVNGLDTDCDTGSGHFSFSASGSLAFLSGGGFPDPNKTMVWVDRKGEIEAIPAPVASYIYPRISPDGQRVAVSTLSLNSDIWVYDLSRETLTRLTVETSSEMRELWHPDGNRITFATNKEGRYSVFEMPADRSGPMKRLTQMEGVSPASWLPNGQELACVLVSAGSIYDIWIIPSEGEPRPFISSSFQKRFPVFSPDGHWLAYSSNQSGRNEVYVTPYPGPGPKIQISVDGGIEPAWARSGQELFFRGLIDNDAMSSMYAVDIKTDPRFVPGIPTELFKNRLAKASPLRNYDVAPDDQRFLMIRAEPDTMEDQIEINVVLNWFEELKRLVPTGR